MRRFTALVNPIAGRGRAAQRWAPIGALLVRGGAEVDMVQTRSREHAVEAAAAAAGQARIAVAVGGDGIVRDVATGVVRGGGTMGIVPAGRGNDLAAALHLPVEPDALADLLLHGTPKPIDVIAVGDTMVPGNVYCGIDAVAGGLIERMRWMTPWLAYRLAPILAIATWRAPRFTVTVDGASQTLRAHTVVVGNSGRYGHGLRIVPSAQIDDARLDVLLVGNMPRWAVVAFLRQARTGSHLHRPQLSTMRGSTVTLAADRNVPVGGDGELVASLPVVVQLRPAALPLLRP